MDGQQVGERGDRVGDCKNTIDSETAKSVAGWFHELMHEYAVTFSKQ